MESGEPWEVRTVADSGGGAGPGPQWHWNGQEWLWWDGSRWVEAGTGPVGEGSATAAVTSPAGEAGATSVVATTAPAAAAPVAVATQPPPAAFPAAPQKKGLGAAGIWAIVLGGLLALVLIGGLIAFLVSQLGGDDDVVTLQTEPLSTSVAAFTPPMGVDTPVAAPAAATGLQTVPAQTVGLFGGTLNNSSCNKDQLVAYLQANPDKAGPWAQTLGITAAQIPSFVAPLTPVVLRSDTVVTNHGFENGKITTMPAVLQAGTAVLVNQFGQPVVKCYCGNPLTPAPQQLSKVTYTGPTWPAFQPGAVTVVQPSTVVINSFVLVDVTTNQTFVRTAGTAGSADAPSAVTAPQTLPTTPPAPTPQPSATTPAPTPTAAVESGREGVAIEAVKNAYRTCSSVMGSTEGVEEVIAGASFSAAPTGQGAGEYSVTVADSSGTFEYIVNVDSGSVAAVNADAQLVADACPGVFD